MLCTALGKLDKQAEILENWVGVLSRELDVDMEARSRDCSTADMELTRILATMNNIQSKTAETENRKRGIAKRFAGVRSIIVGKMEEASEYDRADRVRVRTKLQEVARQVRSGQDSQGQRDGRLHAIS